MNRNPFTVPLRERMNDPQFDWARTRKRRRQLVSTFVALLIAMPILTWIFDSVVVIFVMLLPFVLVMGSLNAGVRGLSELKAGDLDERENRMREPVYARLYWAGVFVATVAGALIANPAALSGLVLVSLGLSFFNLAMALPTLWLAWTIPDEPAPE
jgi:hypothetical protein